MSNKNSSIHEFDFNLICEYFLNLKRQGPGSPEVTQQALSFIDNLTQNSTIADIGCGTGGEALILAKNTPAKVVGLDLFPAFIQKFKQQIDRENLGDRMDALVGNMDNLPFRHEEVDVIWSEGAIYNIGFRRGVNEWRKFIKKGGYIAVSEVSWFTNERPSEIERFWMDAYAEIDTIANKAAQLQEAGYLPVATFSLPESCWTEHFYEPQIQVQKEFLVKHAGNSTVDAFIANQRYEAEMYSKYKDYYGYVFYIGKKI